jgi:hypothetical protein
VKRLTHRSGSPNELLIDLEEDKAARAVGGRFAQRDGAEVDRPRVTRSQVQAA